MERHALQDLIEWKTRPARKPLVIRGARQVGKTWLVRKFAEQFENLVEINFDKTPEKAQPQLFYWNREQKGSNAEIDYLLALANQVVPVEVKAGKTGSLKSLQVFVCDKKSTLALRFNSMPPCCTTLETSIPGRPRATFTLVSLPLYLVGQAQRLLKCAHNP